MRWGVTLLNCTVLLGSAFGVATKAGLELPVWTIVGVPSLVGFVLWQIRRRTAPPSLVSEVVPA